jgi:hypothetical protein
MGSAGIDHQVGVEGASLPVITRPNFDPVAVVTTVVGGAQRGYLSAFENGDLVQTPAELEDGRFDKRTARKDLPKSSVVALTPPARRHGSNVPTGFHCYGPVMAHPLLEAGEKALEFAQAARQQIMDMAGLWYSRAKLVSRRIGIALDNRDMVDKVIKDTGGAHTGQAAADHDCIGGSHRARYRIKPLVKNIQAIL